MTKMQKDGTDAAVALYARVSSERQDVDLSVAAQLRALRDFASKNGFVVAREYIDEAESGRIASRPEFRRMIDDATGADAPFNEILVWKFFAVHSQAGARRRVQVHVAAQGRPRRFHHRARGRHTDGEAHGRHHRKRRRILL